MSKLKHYCIYHPRYDSYFIGSLGSIGFINWRVDPMVGNNAIGNSKFLGVDAFGDSCDIDEEVCYQYGGERLDYLVDALKGCVYVRLSKDGLVDHTDTLEVDVERFRRKSVFDVIDGL